jgi:hypothetical protein
MSAIFPKGTRNMAEVKRYAVVTQLSKMASIKNSCPMEGREILTEDILKGPIKATRVVTSKTYLFVSVFSIPTASVILTSIKGF